MAQEPDEQERWKQNCLAKANYCAWAAKTISDDRYAEYLKTLAGEWRLAANQQPRGSTPPSETRPPATQDPDAAS